MATRVAKEAWRGEFHHEAVGDRWENIDVRGQGQSGPGTVRDAGNAESISAPGYVKELRDFDSVGADESHRRHGDQKSD